METMPMGRLVLNMSLPMMFSLLVQSLYNIVDSIFVSRISEEALTATSLAYPIQMLMVAVGVGTAVGVNAALSQTLGRKDYGEASQIAVTGLFLAVVSGVVFGLAGLLGVGWMASRFTSEVATAALCRDYLWVCMTFSLGNMVCMLCQRLLQAAGNTFLSMVILVTGAVTNLLLDPVLIFGLLGCPALGVRGAAWATVIGQWISMALGLALNLWRNPSVRLTLRGFTVEAQRIRAIYRVGLPTAVSQAVSSMMVTTFNAILLPLSATAVAFFGVYYKLQCFLVMPMSGLGQAAIPIVGFQYGARDRRRILEAVRVIFPAAVGMGVAGTLLFQLMGGRLLALFSAGEEMVALGVPAMKVISLGFVPTAITTMTGYLASGMGDGVTNMVGGILRQLCPLIPCAWLLARLGGVDCIWYAFWVSELTALGYSLLRLRRLKARLPEAQPVTQPA